MAGAKKIRGEDSPVDSAVKRHSENNSNARLSDPEIRQEISELKEKLRNDANFRARFLKAAGVVTSSGKVSKKYAGAY